MELLEEVVEAHGGSERWLAATRISARAHTGGLLPRTRMPGNRLVDYRVEVEVAEQRARLSPFPEEGRVGVFSGGQVAIETADGEVIESRADSRRAFFGLSGVRRNLRWDALDTVYFAGYAMWNYLTFPRLLMRDDVSVTEGEDWDEDGERWRRLEVELPSGIETHARHQTFYFDPLRLLRRNDYVAEVVGGWARAAHFSDEHVEASGLVFPTRRRVRPVGRGNRALARPTLVSIDLSEIAVD
jgi:hypothetical protein